MEWIDLLSKERLGRAHDSDDVRSPFQRDFDRIVFSTAFRRLQDKAQVFPLAESDYVRTRLTHSIEVASVGRSLGALAGEFVVKQAQLPDISPQDFGNIVAAACLAHDLGNPPFGHSGEEAIQSWFKGSGAKWLEPLDPEYREDFLKWEGNAQGFRLLTRLQNSNNEGGLQLTKAVLATFSKYPRQAFIGEMVDSKNASEKKHGFFMADKDSFSDVANATGIRFKRDGAWTRHPLAFLMEAADDICYRIVDLEDGCRLGRVSVGETESLLKQVAFSNEDEGRNSSAQSIRDDQLRIEYLRARAINSVIFSAVDVFQQKHEAILNGKWDDALISGVPQSGALNAVRSLSKKSIYSAPSVLQIEAAGFEVLGGLLDVVVPAIAADQGNRTPRDNKLLQLIPAQFQLGGDRYERLLAATDYVSGMTDTFAVTFFRRVRGFELPRG